MLYRMTLMSGMHHSQATVMYMLLQCHQVENQQVIGMLLLSIIIILASCC